MLLHFAINTSDRKKTQVASLCNLCDDHVHYSDSCWWDKLCSNDGQTTLYNNRKRTSKYHQNTNKKAILDISDHLYQCQLTNSIISTLTFISAQTLTFVWTTFCCLSSTPPLCVNTDLRVYTDYSVFLKRYQFQQQTRCSPRRLSIPHPLILFGQVLDNIKW